MGAQVIAMGRNRDTLKRLEDTYKTTNRLTTVLMAPTLEENISALRAASPTGFSAILDVSPPAAANNTYFPAALSLLKQGGRVAFMGGMGAELRVPFEEMVHRDLKFVGKFMYSREQVFRAIQMAEAGLLELGEKGGVVTKGGYALDDIEGAVKKAAEESSWGVQVAVEP